MFKAVFSVSFFTIVSRIFGLLRDQMQAAFLGASPLMDAVAVALKVPSLFRKLFAEGAFNASFVPAFAGVYATEGQKKADLFAGQILALLLLVVVSVVLVCELVMPWLVPLFAPGLVRDPWRLNQVIAFSRVTFPFLLMVSLNAFFSGILNSADRFAAAAASPAVGNISIILVLWSLAHTLETPAHALVWGVLSCGVVQVLWVWTASRRAGFRIRLVRPVLTPALRRFVRAFGPGVVGSGVSQINMFVDLALGSLLPAGGISYLYYADRLNLLPLGVIGTAIGTALLPVLSKQIQTGKDHEARASIVEVMRYALLLCLPATAGLLTLAVPVIRVLFERQKFTAVDTGQTAAVLQAFACGLPAYVMIKVMTTIFFAHRDTRTPVIVGAGAIVLNIGFSFLLMPLWAHKGLALSTALTAWINMAALSWILVRRQWLVWGVVGTRIVPRVLGAALCLSGFLLVAKATLLDVWIHPARPWPSAFVLGCVILTGIVMFMLLGAALGVVQVRVITRRLNHWRVPAS